jgi:hypothetical protein
MEDELLKELLELFPQKILQDFSKKIEKIRYRIEQYVPSDKKLKEYIIEKYNFIEIKEGAFDKNIIMLLENNYYKKGNYTRKFFENTLDITRQAVDLKIKTALNGSSIDIWEVSELSKLIIENLNKMIEMKNHILENEEYITIIFANGENSIILSYNKKNRKFIGISNQESLWIKKIKENNMHKYFKEDFENIEYCNKIKEVNRVNISSKELIKSINNDKMSLEKYIEFLGFEYVHTNKFYDEKKVKTILSKYIYPETDIEIYIPTYLEDAQLIRRLASRANYSTKDFIEKFGYVYHREDGLLRVKRVLMNIKNINNEVCFPAQGKFYNAICRQAYLINLNLLKFINGLNLIKIEEKPIEIKEADKEYAKIIDEMYSSFIIKKDNNIIENKEILNEINIIESGIEDDISELEKEVIIKQRIGQSKFRENLINKDCSCKICGEMIKELLIASHIKPWAESKAEEKLDIENGFLLCPNHDYLFDKGFISFDNNGIILISTLLDEKLSRKLSIYKNIKIILSERNKYYLKYHREKHCFNNIIKT